MNDFTLNSYIQLHVIQAFFCAHDYWTQEKGYQKTDSLKMEDPELKILKLFYRLPMLTFTLRTPLQDVV